MVAVLQNPVIKRVVNRSRSRDTLTQLMGKHLILNMRKTYETMTQTERQICVRAIVTQVESEKELAHYLALVLGVNDFHIRWHLAEPDDVPGQEARMLVEALGGLVSKNGALVMIYIHDEEY
ncbi:MAG: hypothetical protein NTX72_04895 [Candidatus Uhrbacteria bacterium]|nr:hypothetical protein [Candidatus Uhrbacteria bacterium]